MKTTKTQLKRIIKEEIQNLLKEDNENSSSILSTADKQQLVKNLQALREKFKTLYNNIVKAKGFDSKEIILFNALIDATIVNMQDENAATPLTQAIQKLGGDITSQVSSAAADPEKLQTQVTGT